MMAPTEAPTAPPEPAPAPAPDTDPGTLPDPGKDPVWSPGPGETDDPNTAPCHPKTIPGVCPLKNSGECWSDTLMVPRMK